MPARGWWFPANSTRPGEHIMSRHVVNTVSDACKRAGIPGGTAHRLRHWYGTNLVASGADLRTALFISNEGAPRDAGGRLSLVSGRVSPQWMHSAVAG